MPRNDKASGKKRAPRLDAANLAGVTSLMNPLHLRPGVNLDEAEKAVMGKTGTDKKIDGDPVRLYTAELNQLAEELGIDLLDDEPLERRGAPAGGRRTVADILDEPAPARPSRRPDNIRARSGGDRVRSESTRSYSSRSRGAGYGGARAGKEQPSYTPKTRPVAGVAKESLGPTRMAGRAAELVDRLSSHDDGSSYTSEYTSEYYSDESTGSGTSGDTGDSGSSGSYSSSNASARSHRRKRADRSDDDEVNRIISRLEDDLGIRTGGKQDRDRGRSKSRHHRHHSGTRVPITEPRREERATAEQERHRHINSVIQDIRGETRTTFGVERERVQDIKTNKLEQIGQLRLVLEEEGIDCSTIGIPSMASPIDEIDGVLNILRLKNDRNRYSSLAEEVILGAAEGIETVFDGTRTIPILGWQPDYTGYHSTVACKLHRMRFETSQVVGNIIEKYNIGPTARIIMELLPSFFLYPRQQKKQRGQPGLANEPHTGDARMAINTIRSSDDRQRLDDI